ncbi:MAG: S8 family serine peptidase [Muribaculaceae bacterium]|nr:S8 family serine peptidase [Muribaculaceae bacterium]
MKKANFIIALATVTAFGAQAQKLSPNAEALLLSQKGRTASMLRSYADTAKVEVETVKVFIDVNDPKAYDTVEKMGGRVYFTYGATATAEVPVSALRAVSELSTVDYVDMGAPIHLCMDQVRQACYINEVHTNASGLLPQGYTGKGVVVGVIDKGLDYDHVAFRDADGNTRIKRIWDQTRNGKAPARFGYGCEYTTIEEMRAARTDDDTEYHGTHTTSIAAGGDRASAFYGVAPDADIVFVRFDNTTASIPNAIEYIKDYAASEGKPCVVNMSLGSHQGPHDGTSSLDRYFSRAAGPGVIFVGSAGNEGEYNLHAGKTFTDTDTQLKTILKVPSTSSKNTALDIWSRKGTPIKVEMVLVDVKGRVIEALEVMSNSTQKASRAFSDDGVSGYFNFVPAGNAEGTAQNVYIECYISSVSDARRIGVRVTGESGDEVNMWNLASYDLVNGGFRGWTAGDNRMTVGEIGGTSPDVISVGSFNTRFTFPIWSDPDPSHQYATDQFPPEMIPVGEISSFSSRGPSADGRMKPDVLAPGALVIAGMNGGMSVMSGVDWQNVMNGRTIDSNNKAHYYYLNIGTSMASPVVAGNMALWLEANPDLTPQQALDALKNTARLDANTGSEPNNSAGYGKLDAYSGIRYVLAQKAGIESVATDAQSSIKVWMDGGRVYVSSPEAAQAAVYTVSGAQVGTYSVAGGIDSFDASAWTPGIYVVRVGADAVKIAIR